MKYELPFIACIFNDKSLINKYSNTIRPEHLQNKRLAKIYEYVVSENTTDFVIINNKSNENFTEENHLISMQEVKIENIDEYAQGIIRLWNESLPEKITEIIRKKVKNKILPPDVITYQNELEKNIYEMQISINKERSIEEIETEFWDDVLSREPITTGVDFFDQHEMLKDRTYNVIGGAVSHGKTALGIYLLIQLSKKLKCLFVSCEMTEPELRERMVKYYLQQAIPPFIKNFNKFSDEFKAKYNANKDKIFNKNLVIEYYPTLEQIEQLIIDNNYKIILVDYIQNIQCNLYKDCDDSMVRSRINYVTTKLHNMARKYKVVIIALSQLNRESLKNKGRHSNMSLKETAKLEESADTIMFIQRIQDEDDFHRNPYCDYDIYYTKNRYGRFDVDAIFRLDFKNFRFKEIEKIEDKNKPSSFINKDRQ